MSGLWFEEFQVGASWRTGARRLTRADVTAFSELSGDVNPLHLDDAYARAAGFDGRIAQGALGVAVVTGLVNQLRLTAGTLIALLGLSMRFERPLYPGTVVHVAVTAKSIRSARRADRGVIVLDVALQDDNAAIYQRGEMTLLVRRKSE